MARKKLEQPQEIKLNPKEHKSVEFEEKHKHWRFFLLDFKNIIGYNGRVPRPPETNDDSEKINQFFEYCTLYRKFITVEEQYSQGGYDKSILPQLLKYCPEEVARLNDLVYQINEAVKDKDIEKVRILLKESEAYLNSFSGKAKR